jgi:hypothetical protein
MPTCGTLIDNVIHQLHGWGSTQDRVTALAAPIGVSDTSFTVTDAFGQAVGISPGIVEIDSEQLYVKTVDPPTGICTLINGFGRGYHGTTPMTHANGAMVVTRPHFPRQDVFRNLNSVIGAVFPDLFAVGEYTTTVTWPQNTYNIPIPKPLKILDVQWQHPIGDWLSILTYNVDSFDQSIRLGEVDAIAVGRPLRFVYSYEPNLFVAETDDFATVTGLAPTTQDVLELGVVAKMLAGLDISRAQLTSVEQSDRARVVPPNSGVNAAKWVQAEFQNRLQNESISLRRQYPPRLHRRFSF